MANFAFVPGDLVVSLSGDGDGSGTYTDNQASPIVLQQLTLTGTAAGTLVLPQSGNTISGEYGSSSEGSLQLSTDGQSLTIAGYGVDAVTYNSGGAAVYGNAALAQTTSVQGGQFTAVARVIADIRYDGTIDTSTRVYNVDNMNNPRSVVTVDGKSFYLAGQGVKGDTTQGTFRVADGASSGTPIDTSVDERTAEIYNGNLYVSVNTGQNNQAGIYTYGGLPTSATAPTPLPGIGPAITLSAGQANGLNTSRIGNTVYLAPENFFFANASTLYIADDGKPKNGSAGKAGLGDGGLQKWSLDSSTGTWTLDYTLTAGLNLVVNTTADPGQGGNATTGLIGLTGRLDASTGMVALYATNATVGDLNQTYLYGITDDLAATTLPTGESFTQLYAAPADTNVRGVAFAPQAPACFASGTLIRTDRGEVAVEALREGDLVMTASGTLRPIRWLGHRTIDCRRQPRPEETHPIRIAAHAFGDNRPSRDLFVSPKHAICVDVLGEVLIPACALVNGSTVRQVEVDVVTYWHIELAGHDVVLAENLPSESYVDCGNRGFFVEADVAVLHAAPDARPASTDDYCRPFHAGGDLVELVRSQLSARAAATRLPAASPMRTAAASGVRRA